MARDQEPVTEADIAELREEMAAQRDEIREALAEDLGGEPDDYDAARYFNERESEPVADGGE